MYPSPRPWTEEPLTLFGVTDTVQSLWQSPVRLGPHSLYRHSEILIEIPGEEQWKILFKQIRIGMAMGIIAGILISFFSLIIDSKHHVLSVIVGFSLFMSITISGLMGAAIPFVLNRFNIDPAVAAGPFITNFNDVISIFIYLSLATGLIVFLV